MPVSKRFRPRGPGRFLNAGFLSLWLCAWLAGEIAVLYFLGTGLYALITGQPLPGADHPVQLGPALATGAFLLFWLTLWTLGGILAIRELLRTLSGEDLLRLDGLWLSERASVPLQDHVPTDASRQAELDRLRTHLATSGKLGRWMAGFLSRVANRRERR